MKGKPEVCTNIPFKVVSVASKEDVKINFIDAFQWMWDYRGEEWHISYVIDFCIGERRFVIGKFPVVCAFGVTGEKCDYALKEFIGTLDHDRKHGLYPDAKTREVEFVEIEVPAMIVQKHDALEEGDCDYCKDLLDEGVGGFVISREPITSSFSVKAERPRERYRQMSLFDLTEQI